MPLWAVAAGLGAFVLLQFEAPIMLLSIPVGALGVVLGIAAIRAAGGRSRDWWLGIVATVLGCYPTAVAVILVVGTLRGWIEWR